MKAYAGIGSRELPVSVKQEFIQIGQKLAQSEYILRSGGADGADMSFEIGCNQGSGSKEIFLPWKGFNGNSSSLVLPVPIPSYIENIASKLYPRWQSASFGTRALHARNVYQILGWELCYPSSFVVCYSSRPYDDPQAVGGTLFGIKLAEANHIPVYNFYLPGQREQFYSEILTKNNEE